MIKYFIEGINSPSMEGGDSEVRRQLLIKDYAPLSGYGRERLVFSYDYNINFQHT